MTEENKIQSGTVSVDVARLLALLKCASVWSAAPKDYRPHLSGVHFECDGVGLTIVATNGSGLWFCENAVEEVSGAFSFTVDGDDLAELMGLLKRALRRSTFVELLFAGRDCIVSVGRTKLTLSDVSAFSFPAWRKIVAGEPKAEHVAIGVDAAYLGRVAKSLPTTRGIRVALRGSREPMRFDARLSGAADEVRASVVLMPMIVDLEQP